MPRLTPDQLLTELSGVKDLLLVQDLDGVCMQLVRDPLARRLDASYVKAAADLQGSFVVLTNGEHEARRGVNRLVETALGPTCNPAQDGLYLPGLAAGGVQLQDRFGTLSHPGVSAAEMDFLAAAPARMQQLLFERLPQYLPDLSSPELETLVQGAVLDTQVSPTINLNGAFALLPNAVEVQCGLQQMLEKLMNQLLLEAEAEGLQGSFFLHVAPNLGRSADGTERIKPAVPGDVGTTDIQFMLTGSLKEAGLLVLLNQHIARRWGHAPFGESFHVRTAPRDHASLLALVQEHVSPDQMPVLVGVGDTVTSTPAGEEGGWLRGGSDRGFLQLLQDLGQWCGKPNRVVLVDSSHGEIDRPSLKDGQLEGISDPADPLQVNVLMPGGPEQYIHWFIQLADRRKKTPVS